MASGWKRGLGNVRSFVGNSLGGLRGTTSLASWLVAGTLAYFLWVRPSQQLKREQQERAAAAASDPYRYIEKRKPIPDSQDTGLVYGSKNGAKRSEGTAGSSRDHVDRAGHSAHSGFWKEFRGDGRARQSQQAAPIGL